MPTTLGSRIRKARTEAGLTAEQLAPQVGVTTGTVFRWERGENAISVAKLTSVAEVTGKDLSYFISEEAA